MEGEDSPKVIRADIRLIGVRFKSQLLGGDNLSLAIGELDGYFLDLGMILGQLGLIDLTNDKIMLIFKRVMVLLFSLEPDDILFGELCGEGGFILQGLGVFAEQGVKNIASNEAGDIGIIEEVREDGGFGAKSEVDLVSWDRFLEGGVSD